MAKKQIFKKKSLIKTLVKELGENGLASILEGILKTAEKKMLELDVPRPKCSKCNNKRRNHGKR